MSKIQVFDTTLRDGEQSPGVNLNKNEKLEIAKQLENMRVDIIEAGFPAASTGDFEAVKQIADTVKNSTVTALARCIKGDIDRAYEALQNTKTKRIHIFLATSSIHREYKLNMTQDEVIDSAVSAIRYAKEKFDIVQWSAEDATRTELPFLKEIIEHAIEAGADVINLPDTVGNTTPEEYKKMFQYVTENVRNIDSVILSTHCHNDLGMAVANTISGIDAGARQMEVSMNGIGERAGNASLEEVVIALFIRKDFYPYYTDIKFDEIMKTSEMVSRLSGMSVQQNKAVVGQNAYQHEAGIHQDGVLKNPKTYEIITPELVGVKNQDNIFLGKHSGSHAFKKKVAAMNIEVNDSEMKQAFKTFKTLTDTKKEVTDDDIYAILMEIKSSDYEADRYELVDFTVYYETKNHTKAIITVKDPKGNVIDSEGSASGSVEALFKAFVEIIPYEAHLQDFQIKSIGSGKDALASAHIEVEIDGLKIKGRGTDQDVLEASINGYINVINRYIIQSRNVKDKQYV